MSALSILKWAGTVAQIAGVFALAGRPVEPSIAFGVMLIGSSIWVAAAVAMREWSVLALNLAFTVSNVLGIWRWQA